MSVWRKFLDKFSLYDLIVIAMVSALGIAVKPIIAPLSHILAGPLLIPPGAVTGGIYMMWLVLGFGITGKRGTMTLIGLVQAILVMATGMVGSQGVMSLLSYTAPGILADLGLLLIGHRVCCLPCAFLAGMLCNIAGTVVVNLVYYRFPAVPLLLSLSVAALSGGLGGVIAFKIVWQIRKFQKQDQNISKG
ncbi:ECF transporter S component [Pelotomaculum terephthalicicum JT]|uniref:ECF transporter S component n=1 Tax=Pelotomaculum terephthalicicum TaxID=206393 RepID=UPI001F042D71|nr:ECF transporter S component [Pelotomaculum terephthalicicum]MCG9967271.1 ECF transporter S component [Pelotomaculum terephthalicicum JT]